MNQPDQPPPQTAAQLEETLRRLEARIARIEAYLQLGPLPEVDAVRTLRAGMVAPSIETEEEKEEALEHRIGEFWLARVGIVALLVGTAFFIAYPIAVLPPLLHSLIGYSSVVGLFFFARVWRATYPYLSRILFRGGLILLYYATLRLHFFSAHPIISNKLIALTL